jgi:hypothetical protein
MNLPKHNQDEEGKKVKDGGLIIILKCQLKATILNIPFQGFNKQSNDFLIAQVLILNVDHLLGRLNGLSVLLENALLAVSHIQARGIVMPCELVQERGLVIDVIRTIR